MYDTVLFPTDGSETATEAAAHAIDLADRHDATLHVLYVVDHERVSRMAPKLGTDHIKETLQQEGERATGGWRPPPGCASGPESPGRNQCP